MKRFSIILIILALLIAVPIALAQEDDTDRPSTDLITYVVDAGDTLNSIAELFNVQFECLLETNELTAQDTVQADDVILIDPACPEFEGDVADTTTAPNITLDVEEADDEAATADFGEATTYVVERGDTLDTIGQALNVSVEAIVLANDIEDPGFIEIGQTLTIPGGPPYGQVPSLDDTAGQGGGAEGDLYVVQRGDTLDTIGQELNVSVESLKLTNNISDGRTLRIGQTLVIPEDAPPYGQVPALDGGEGQGGGAEGELYVVQRGDTLDTIGQELNVSVVSLKVANDISDGRTLRIGQTLLIPEDAPPYGQFPALDGGEGQGGGAAGDLYVVQPLETIDGISARFNVSYTCVLDANNIVNPRQLQPGTVIVIPDDCPAYTGADVVPTR